MLPTNTSTWSATTDRANRFNGTLESENRHYAGSGGTSPENRHLGLVPGFLDRRSGKVYRSRFANGQPAPVHVLEGLPSHLRAGHSRSQSTSGQRLISGFLLGGRFYNRDEAAALLSANSNR